MNLEKLIEFVSTRNNGWSFDIDDALYAATDDGLIETPKYLGTTDLRDRRWGVSRLFVYEVDGEAIGFQVYVMHSEDAEDIFETAYPVESYEVVETRWRRLND